MSIPDDAGSARPTDLDQPWLDARREALVHCLTGPDRGLAASSGCASTGAARHADERESQAARALERLAAGLAGSCEDCGGPIPRERLDAVLTTTCCLGCAGPSTVDTRWCR